MRKISGYMLIWLSCCGVVLPSVSAADATDYEVRFLATFVPEEGIARATIVVDQDRRSLRELDLNAPADRYRSIKGDGALERNGDRMIWQPPRGGGRLTYDYVVDQKRGSAYDARLTSAWAIVRLGDLFPRANARAAKSAIGRFEAKLAAPESWAIESQYGDLTKVRQIDNVEKRKYVRPTGWVAAGELGVRREKIGEHRFVVAAPKGSGFRRLDTLAILQWTMPTFMQTFSQLPGRILIVGAPQGMWRGALSGPGSFFVHVDLPVISENGTSVLLHELAHLAGLHSADAGGDWIVEGLAEYYGIELARRAGGISDFRFDLIIEDLKKWVESAGGEISDPSKGADTAAAVLLFHDLAQELQVQGHSLDTVLNALLEADVLNSRRLAQVVTEVLGRASETLAAAM